MVTVVVLLALVALRLAVLAAIALLLIPPGRRCPACGEQTVPLQRSGIARLLPRIERRWCVACGWSWFRKRAFPLPRSHAPTPRFDTARRSGLG